MKLTILGCGDAFGSGGRNNSGYLVEAGGRMFLLDCGPTTLLALKRAGFDPARIDAVFLSHLHGDHAAGLPFFFTDYLHEHPRARPLHVAGPSGTEERVRGMFRWVLGQRAEPRDPPPTAVHERCPAVHINYRKVRKNLPRRGAKKILLTHLGEEMLARRAEIHLPLAEDGM